MSRLLHAVLVFCVATVALATIPGALASGPYGLDSPSAVDVPGQTVMGAGEFLTVREVARVTEGDPFVVRATAPADAEYGVELRNVHGMVVDISNRTLRGNDSTAFPTNHLRPGSYVAVLYDRGEVRAVLPVVVEGYGVSAAAPDAVEAGTNVTVSANLTATASAPETERVEVLVVDRSNGDAVVRRNMTADGEGYATSVRLEEPGEYRLGVNVRGETTVREFDELLGFSDAQTLSVTAPESPTAESATDAAAGTGSEATTPSGTGTPTASPTAPEEVITRNPTDGSPTSSDGPPTSVASVLFGLLLAVGIALIYVLRL